MPAPVYKVTSMTCGVYSIICIPTGQVYIGSSRTVKKRWRTHKRDLNLGVHKNRNLQKAYDSLGAGSFKFRLLEKCSSSELVAREQSYMDSVPTDLRFNISPTAGSNLGFRHSEETRRKISDIVKNMSDETRQRMAASQRGRKHTEESLKKMRGKKKSEETRRKMSESKKRENLSDETRRRLREAWKLRKARKEVTVQPEE